MLTDKQNKIFSIIKNTSDSLIIKKGIEKYIRKTYVLQEQILKHIVQRQNVIHKNLINLYQIEFSHAVQEEKYAFQVVYEHYCHTLQEFIKGENLCWQEQQLINTFQPIIQVVDYLVKQKVSIQDFSFKNIVITQNQDIKFIDSFFTNKEIVKTDILLPANNFNQTMIYQKIAQKIFTILYPKQSTKSWKNRLKIIKQNSLKSTHTFISQILSKSLSKGYDLQKSKKIKKIISSKKKQNIQDVMNKIKKEQKNQKEFMADSCMHNMSNKHQGKENKLQQ